MCYQSATQLSTRLGGTISDDARHRTLRFRKKDPDKLIVRIPASVASKADLLAILAEELSFPDYFGENWDALEEMLGDLSWLEPKRIVLAHESTPTQIGEDNLRIYRDILLSSVTHWKSHGQRELIVIFPD